ncbi:protein of unknown function [Paraburkholderia kururiensis]|uniref:GNAT family N-acetyltransferase n=1 Tax=Paraburkholderia kururiensis TaxID=984307 RepID=UPI0039A58E3D
MQSKPPIRDIHTRKSEALPPIFELEPIKYPGEPPAYFAPLVRMIFPARAEAIIEIFRSGAIDVDPASTHPFAVKTRDEYIGITGFYLYNENSVGLCWHGIIPSMRGLGISRAVFAQTCTHARARYPNVTEIIELIPSDRDDELTPYFKKLGFSHNGEIATFEYLPKEVVWRVYRAPLSSSIDLKRTL